jgi:hypothetical protein
VIDEDQIDPSVVTPAAPATEGDPPTRTNDADQPVPAAPQPNIPAPVKRGFWECLNEPRYCSLAAPDPRTKARYFEGPTQDIARAAGPEGTVSCPECGFKTVIYRGDAAA